MNEDDLLSPDQFRLFAVSARYPQQLAGELGTAMRPLMEGVYEVSGLGLNFRIVVPNQLRQEEHNALLHLFSTRGELLIYGGSNYHMHSPDTSTLLLQLFRRFQQEIPTMPTPLEEFARETIEELLKELPVKKRLEGLSAGQRLEGLSVEELVKSLSPETLRELVDKVKETGTSPKPE